MKTTTLKTNIRAGQIIELAGGNSQYRILETWDGWEGFSSDKPVLMGKIQRLKDNGQPYKSEKPRVETLEFHYGGEPAINGRIIETNEYNGEFTEVQNSILREVYNDLKEIKEANGDDDAADTFEVWCMKNSEHLAGNIADYLEDVPLNVNGYSIRHNRATQTFNLSHPGVGANFESYKHLRDAYEAAIKG